MLDSAIGDLLPAAVAVAISPIPIVAVVLVLSGSRARTSGLAFAAGWVLGLGAVSVVAVLVLSGVGADDPGSAASTGVAWGRLTLGVALLVLGARQWAKRPAPDEEPEMPKWMASIDAVGPGRALRLGCLLSAANPKNLALTLAASASIAQAGLDSTGTVLAVTTFVLVGSLTVVGAVVFDLVAPTAAAPRLARVRQVMSDNNAVIMTVILVILGAKLIGDALPGL